MTNDHLDIAEQLRIWEGEYHYPNGLLLRAAEVIEGLLREIERLRALLRKISEETCDY